MVRHEWPLGAAGPQPTLVEGAHNASIAGVAVQAETWEVLSSWRRISVGPVDPASFGRGKIRHLGWSVAFARRPWRHEKTPQEGHQRRETPKKKAIKGRNTLKKTETNWMLPPSPRTPPPLPGGRGGPTAGQCLSWSFSEPEEDLKCGQPQGPEAKFCKHQDLAIRFRRHKHGNRVSLQVIEQ